MKNIKSRILVVSLSLLMILGVSGCEDFLTETNPNQISTESFWKTLGDLEKGLVAVYASFSNNAIYQIADENHRSDIDWPGWGRPNTSNPFFLQTFTNAENTVRNKWSSLYTVIFRANCRSSFFQRSCSFLSLHLFQRGQGSNF